MGVRLKNLLPRGMRLLSVVINAGYFFLEVLDFSESLLLLLLFTVLSDLLLLRFEEPTLVAGCLDVLALSVF
jgi:hypothetical protein